jgi:hypothetical protein
LNLTGTITATAGDIGGWKIQEDENGSPGIYSGNQFLPDNEFGSFGELTISSQGYIAGNRFKISKQGNAHFQDLTATENINFGQIRKDSTEVDMNLSANTGFYPNFDAFAGGFYFYTDLVTRTFSTISPDYITVSFSMPGIVALNVTLTDTNLNPVVNTFQIYGQSQTEFIINVGRIAIGGMRVEAISSSQLSTSSQYSFQILQRFNTNVVLQSLVSPTNDFDAATKKYVDDRFIITGVSTPLLNNRSYGQVG